MHPDTNHFFSNIYIMNDVLACKIQCSAGLLEDLIPSLQGCIRIIRDSM